ncbi:MAG TPA: hypothetical protein EYG88_02870 [Desulfocapsa sulfexigens]|nr:hypothetical protein [Desulfocapsa sulfexigens]
MKVPYILPVITVAIPIVLIFWLAPSFAADKHVHKTYNQRLVKSRADRNYTNNGTIIYNYQEIDSYDDSISGEQIGNIEIERGSRVRQVNNVIIIKDDVKSKKDTLEIGTVSIKKSGRVGTVNNSVTIDGKIDASGESMEIGTVHVNRSGRVQSLNNKVEIDGGINAH